MADVKFQKWLPQGLKQYEIIKVGQKSLENDTSASLQRQLQKQLECIRGELLSHNPRHFEFKFQKSAISALVNFELAKIFQESAAERAKQLLKDAWAVVKKHPMHPDLILLSMHILGRQFALSIGQNRMEKAHMYSREMSCIHKKVEITKPLALVSFSDLFLSFTKRKKKQSPNVLEYICENLKILDQNYFDFLVNFWFKIMKKVIFKGNESLFWSSHLITFSDMLIDDEKFLIARRVISCMAQLTIDCKDLMKLKKIDKEDKIWVKIQLVNMEISHLWGKYMVCLLNFSTKFSGERQPESDENEVLPGAFNNFGSLSETKVREIEEKVPYTPVYGNDAEVLFLFALQHLTDAESYHRLNDETDDHIRVIMSLSKLYATMAGINEDDDSACEKYKYSTKVLETEIKKAWVEPHFPKLHKEMVFDLGKTYFQWANRKHKMFCGSSEVPLIAKKNEMDFLVDHIIGNCQHFLHDFNEGYRCVIPYELIEQGLEAYSIMAQAYLLPIEPTNAKKIENFEDAVKCYKLILSYLEKNPGEEHFFAKMNVSMLDEKIAELSADIRKFKRLK